MKSLDKKLGTLDIFAIVSGVMISSGIFILPGVAFQEAGPAVVISYLIAAFIYIPAIMSVVELATAMPRAGGAYFVVDRSMGPAAGTLGGTASWLSLSLKSAFALVGVGALAEMMFKGLNPWHIKFVAIGFCVVFVLVNLFSVELAGRFQVFLVAGLIGILIYYIIIGSPHIVSQRFIPFAPKGFLKVLATAGMVFVSFTGITKAASMSEETRDPGRTIPKGIFMAYGVTVLLYVLIVTVTVGITPGKDLSFSLTPLADGALSVGGNIALILVNFAAFFAFATTANAGIMAASRDLMAISRDGHLPSVFEKVNKKYNTPHNAILFTGAFIAISILLLPLKMLVKTASSMQIILMIMIMLSVVVMRESRIFSYKPTFKSPLYPYLQIAGIVGMAVLLSDMGLSSVSLALAFLVAALFWFWIYTRIQVKRKPALVYLLERFTGIMPANRGRLKKELTDIVSVRDRIREDAFDALVNNCLVMDMHWSMPMTGFFRKASKPLSRRLDIPADEIYEMLMNSESPATSTPRAGLAMPFLMVEKEVEPMLLMVRNVSGIEFSPVLPPVYAVFIVVIPYHEKALLLKTLMALSEITQRPDFDNNWLNAHDEEELKDLVHFCSRRRIYDVYCHYKLEDIETGADEEIEAVGGRFLPPDELEAEDLYGLPLLEGYDFHCSIFEKHKEEEKEDGKDRKGR